MKTRWSFGAAAAILLGTPSAFAAQSPLPPLIIPRCMGVNIHFTHPRPGEMRMLAHAGFHWVRMDFAWTSTETTRGHYNFSAYDHLLTALKPWHIHPVLILDYGNPLYDHGLAPYDHAGRAAFARWAAAAVQHFKGRRILWEMYNEPNGNWFWKLPPGEKPAARITNYIKLALATGRAIHKADPSAAFIGPAESGMDLSYVKRCFQAGLLRYWCAVSMHPYRQTGPETVAADYQKLKKLIAHYAPRGKHIPIIAGEWGYSSAWKHFTPKLQGQYLAREFLTNISHRIPLTIWYDWHDDGTVPTNSEHNFGTVLFPYHKNHAARGQVYTPKPAYRAATTLSHALAGFHFVRRVRALGAPGAKPLSAAAQKSVFILLFAKGQRRQFVAWTTAGKPQTVGIPAGDGNFRVIDYVGRLVEKAARAGPGGLQMRLTRGPEYIQRQ